MRFYKVRNLTRQNENQVHSIRTGEKEEGEREKERLCVLETVRRNATGSAHCNGSRTQTPPPHD